jgi:hypothetical protein
MSVKACSRKADTLSMHVMNSVHRRVVVRLRCAHRCACVLCVVLLPSCLASLPSASRVQLAVRVPVSYACGVSRVARSSSLAGRPGWSRLATARHDGTTAGEHRRHEGPGQHRPTKRGRGRTQRRAGTTSGNRTMDGAAAAWAHTAPSQLRDRLRGHTSRLSRPSLIIGGAPLVTVSQRHRSHKTQPAPIERHALSRTCVSSAGTEKEARS